VADTVVSDEPLLGYGAWSIDEEPLVSIGEIGSIDEEGRPGHSLSRLQGVYGLHDSLIVVADAMAAEMRVFDARTGDLRWTVGREGEGPGEFKATYGLYQLYPPRGDTLITWDSENLLSFFDFRGDFIESQRIQYRYGGFGPQGQLPTAQLDIVGLTRSRRLVGYQMERLANRPLGEFAWSEWLIVQIHADGVRIDSVGAFPGREYTAFERNGRLLMGLSAVRTGASLAVAGDSIYYARADRFEVYVLTTDGALRVMARPAERLPTSQRVVDATIRREAARAPAGFEEQWAADVRRAVFPDSVPVTTAVLVARDGMVWTRAWARPWESTVEWTVFDVDGRWVTSLHTPWSWRLQDIGEDWVIVVAAEVLDVPIVSKHRLRR
jgi:hypothetical protein